MIFYFTATGNSLYAAKQLDEELYSIPQELKKSNRHYKADKIGIVCPLYEFDLPPIVKKFIRGSEFETEYFYIIVTYGAHHGGVAERAQKFLQYNGKTAAYINSVIMLDNALIVFDMKQQKAIDAEKKVDEHLAAIRKDIEEGVHAVQEASKEEAEFSAGYFAQKEIVGPMYRFPLYTVGEGCVACGTCAKVCPAGCIHLEGKKVVYDYTDCENCGACIHACPKKAIRFGSGIREMNCEERYRNPHIQLSEIIQANNQ